LTPSAPSKHRATGTIAVRSYEPTPYEQPTQGPALVRIHVEEVFSGDIEGTGVAEFLQTQVSADAASFVGIERVSGTIAGRTGTFVLQDEGTLTGSRVAGRWSVVPGSATGELVGLRGDGSFTAELGQGAAIDLAYWFE
jgi:hypothetical protein